MSDPGRRAAALSPLALLLVLADVGQAAAKAPAEYMAALRGGVDFAVVEELKRDPALTNSVFAVCLKDDDARARRSCASMARYIGSPALIEPLRLFLRDPVADVRLDAAASLGELAGEKAIPWITPLTNDSDPSLRAAALSILAKHSEKLPYALFRQKIHDHDPDVQLTAANLLASVGERIPREFALQFIATSTSTPKVRGRAFDLIGYVGNASDLPMLDRVAGTRGPNKVDALQAAQRIRVRFAATPEKRRSLIESAFRDPRLGRWAQTEVVRRYKHGDKPIFEVVKEIAAQSDNPGRFEARAALTLMKSGR